MKVRFVVASVMSIVVLAGCSSKPQLAGAAAIVGDTQIAQSEVTQQVNAVVSEVKKNPSSGAQAPSVVQLGGLVVNRLVVSAVLHRISKDNPVLAVTPKQVDAFMQQLFSQYGEQAVTQQLLLQSAIPQSEIRDFVEDYMLKQSIATTIAPGASQDEQSNALYQYLAQQAKKIGVRVAPRFGGWDEATLQTVAGDNTLSFPATPTN